MQSPEWPDLRGFLPGRSTSAHYQEAYLGHIT
jgi:hypothetical protein